MLWCPRYSQADQWEALLGQHVQGQTNTWTARRNVKRIVAHTDYNRYTYDNDIALMELDSNVTLNQAIWPICLPSPTYDFPAGREAWITGWGATREGGVFLLYKERSVMLQKVITCPMCCTRLLMTFHSSVRCCSVRPAEGGGSDRQQHRVSESDERRGHGQNAVCRSPERRRGRLSGNKIHQLLLVHGPVGSGTRGE